LGSAAEPTPQRQKNIAGQAQQIVRPNSDNQTAAMTRFPRYTKQALGISEGLPTTPARNQMMMNETATRPAWEAVQNNPPPLPLPPKRWTLKVGDDGDYIVLDTWTNPEQWWMCLSLDQRFDAADLVAAQAAAVPLMIKRLDASLADLRKIAEGHGSKHRPRQCRDCYGLGFVNRDGFPQDTVTCGSCGGRGMVPGELDAEG
jgi:hypothetical protein